MAQLIVKARRLVDASIKASRGPSISGEPITRVRIGDNELTRYGGTKQTTKINVKTGEKMKTDLRKKKK